MNKINLIISSVNLDYGGIEKSLLNLLNSLDEKLFNITLVLENKTGVYLNEINKNIQILEYSPSSNKFINLFKRIGWLLKHHNKYDVSICYATYSYPANFIARSSAKKRILFVHSNYYEAFNHDVSKFKEFYDTRFLNEYNKIVFVSNEAKNDFAKIYPEYNDKLTVINNIVDIKSIIKGSKEDYKTKLKNKYIGCFIGRLDEDSKRISMLSDLAKKGAQDDIGFIIVGDGPDKNILESKKLNNVELVGSQSNPYKYLAKSDFLILTSRYEGYPVVYNEAITLGKPILTTVSITDDLIDINDGYGIVSNDKELYDNLLKIIKYKNKKIDFNDINQIRIDSIQKLIKDLYEEN